MIIDYTELEAWREDDQRVVSDEFEAWLEREMYQTFVVDLED